MIRKSAISGWRRLVAVLILAVLTLSVNGTDVISAKVTVDPQAKLTAVDPFFMGMGLHPGERANINQTGSVHSVKSILGLKSIRFPNGCEADRYSWKVAITNGNGWISVDEYVGFCERTGSRPYYTINMQGGTEGLEGIIPSSAGLEERIRYRHTAPNPCGYTPDKYHFGTLAEALELVEKCTVERLVSGRLAILDYELGNENWGQATTDWPPEIYVKTAETYALAMHEVLERAKASHPELKNARLRITAVGYPVMGNNQDPIKATNYDINVRWTEGLNRLYGLGLIGAVQEHFYPSSVGTGDSLVWSEHNMVNIILARKGISNPRLGGYSDPKLAYNMPMEITEWNLKCWGPVPSLLKGVNGEFDTLEGWSTRSVPDGSARFQIDSKAARRGKSGLLIQTGPNCSRAVVRTIIKRGAATEPIALAWLRTDSPKQVSLTLRNGKTNLLQRTATAKSRWQRYSVGGKLVSTNDEAELIFRVSGPNANVLLDNVEIMQYSPGPSRAPISVNAFEQQLYCVDAIRKMIEHGVPRTHFHHVFGSYGCGAVNAAGALKDNSKAFELFFGRLGTEVLQTGCKVETFDYDGHTGQWATDFNFLAPSAKDIPMLSALATRDKGRIHLLLVNRSTDRTINTLVSIPGVKPQQAEVVMLTGEDYNAYGAKLTKAVQTVEADGFERRVGPHSGEMITVEYK